MSKTITLRLSDEVYNLFRRVAESDNRPLSNFIETATRRYIQQIESVDDFEMADIRSNKELNASLRRGQQDAKQKKGRLLD